MKKLLLLGVVGLLALPTGAYAADTDKRSAGKADFGPAAAVATPEGITLQAATRPRRGSAPGAKSKLTKDGTLPALRPRLDMAIPKDTDFFYADARGLALYTYDKDVEPGKSTCVDDCAKAWPPALAPRGTKASGEWSLISRADGSKQWGYKGKPLYTFVKDTKVGETTGNGAQNGIWHSVAFRPTAEIKLPAGFAIDVVRRLNGQALVDVSKRTVYFFDGKSIPEGDCKVSSCVTRWAPVTAAEIARPVGDFSVVVAADSTRQWAYKGKPLFTFSGDLVKGDAHGEGVDAKWHALVLSRYFMPADAKVEYDLVRGAMLTTSRGLTLYRQGVSDHSLDNRSIPYARPGTPSIARAVGISDECSTECLKSWHPFKASSSAKPSGYWDIVTRDDDGTRQWAYKGHPLYTFVGDKKAGDTKGNDTYQMPTFDETKQSDALWVIGIEQGAALYWAFMAP